MRDSSKLLLGSMLHITPGKKGDEADNHLFILLTPGFFIFLLSTA